MKPDHWFVIFKLAEQGALSKPLFTSTATIAKNLSCSQQTASRWLKELREKGLIERHIETRGEYIKISKSGYEQLVQVFSTLRSFLESEKPQAVIIEGKVFSGLGEGAYYVSRDGYKKQFVAKLGYEPYPGTLNLKLTKPAYVSLRKELESYEGITISGFNDGQRTYGPLRCLSALVENKVEGSVLLIQRTHYDYTVLEVMAPICLRDSLKLKDGDLVQVKVLLNGSKKR